MEDESVIDPNTGPMIPTVEEPEVVAPHPFLEGVPASMPEGMGAGYFAQQTEDAQMQPKEVWRQTLHNSMVSGVVEALQVTPSVVEELYETGRADLSDHRERLTKDVPLHLHDEIMGSMTLAGAEARRVRILERSAREDRLAQQVGLSRGAISLAAGLLDADLPLMFATGGTLAAARTARAAATVTKRLTGSTALARVAGDTAVGLSGGALSGVVAGGAGALAVDDFDANDLGAFILSAAATGGVLNPAVGQVSLDRELWSAVDRQTFAARIREAEVQLFDDVANPESAINRARPMVFDVEDSINAASLGTAQRAIDPEVEIENMLFNERNPTETPRAVNPIVTALRAAGAEPAAIRRSLQSEEWRRGGFEAIRDEDLQSRAVQMLTGMYSKEVTIPFSKVTRVAEAFNTGMTRVSMPIRIPTTDRTYDIGSAAGYAFTMGVRDFTNLYKSRSASANFVASEILESASGLGRNGVTASMHREFILSSSLVHVSEPLVLARREHMAATGATSLSSRGNSQFAADARLAMQQYADTGELPTSPAMRNFIEANDRFQAEVLQHLQGISEDLSVRGARDVSFSKGHFRYQWDASKFVAAIRNVGRQEVVDAFARSYARRNGWNSRVANKVALATVRRFEARGLGNAAADSRIINADTSASIEKTLRDAQVDEADIAQIMARMTADSQTRAKAGFLRDRVEADLAETIGGSDMRLVDLMNDDLEQSVHQYATQAAGQAALANKGLRDSADVSNLKAAILAEGRANGEENLSSDFLDAVFSQFGGGAHSGIDPVTGKLTSGVSGITSGITSATRASLLQRMGLTSLMDLANIPVAHGVANFMEPVMARLGFNRSGKLSKADLEDIHSNLEASGMIAGQDHMIYRTEVVVDELGIADRQLLSGVLSGLRSVEKATYYASGHVHVLQQIQKFAAASSHVNAIRSIANDARGTLSNRMLRDMGLTNETIQELQDAIQSGKLSVEPGNVSMDLGGVSKAAEQEYIVALYRSMHQQAQRSAIGETSVWMNSDIGRLLSSLKTFSMTAAQKQTARNLMIGGKPHFLAASAWQVGMSYAVLSLSQSIQGQDMSAADRARLAVTYSPTLGVFPMVVDPITTMLGFDSLNFSPYGRYSSYLDTPAFEQTQKLMRSPGAIADMVTGDGDYDDMQNARAMFFMNWYGMKQVWENM